MDMQNRGYSSCRSVLCVGFLCFLPLSGISASDSALKNLRAVPFTAVRISDSFWAPKREINRTVTIPVNFDNLEKAGNIRNLELAGQRATSGYRGPVYMDSDVYKAIEAASYSLATRPDPVLEKKVESLIAIIAAAQHPDGYLNSYFTVKEPGKRWTNLRDWHELYCAGHLFEAAVAHYQATGRKSLLDVATRFADHIDFVFGPGKRMGYPGHPEIELALVKLWRVTGHQRYFNLARFFVENRGRKFFAEEHNTPLERYDGTYWQDDVPIYEHRNIKGHAVRACYLMSGATDVAAATGDSALLRMLSRVWRNTIEKNQYITGGIGPSAHNEGFTFDYDLPNATAYQETCATIALAQWSHRLALLYGDSRYADAVERALFNGVLSGVSQEGNRFFYVNRLESRGKTHRSEWFGTACCPPNVARTLAALGGYAYAVSDEALWVNLYVQGDVEVNVAGQKVTLKVATEYPWEGKILLQPQPSKPEKFELRLRIPGWCASAAVSVNGQRLEEPPLASGYVVLSRGWKNGDKVELDLQMPVRRVYSHPNVLTNRGLTALQRGPVIYALEEVDQRESLDGLYLPDDGEFSVERARGVLGDVVLLRGTGWAAEEQEWDGKLYQTVASPHRVGMTAIPYYAWDNRKPGSMKVWLPVAPPLPRTGGLEVRAAVSVSFASSNSQPEGLNDGVEPKSSGEQPAALCHWWPHKGTTEWAKYTWKKPVSVSGARVYWFDDTGRGSCRMPVEWHVEYLDGDVWKPAQVAGPYPVVQDRWCEVAFATVKTSSLRLVVTLQRDWAAGVHEWQVVEEDGP